MAAAPTVPLSVPDLVTAVYLVPAPETAGDVDDLVATAVDLLVASRPTAAAEAAPGLRDAGLLAVDVVDRAALPGLDRVELAAASGPVERADEVASAARFVIVTARGRPGLPAVHEWVARGCACALARSWDAAVVDVAVPRLLAPTAGLSSLPGPEGRVRLADWVVVPHAAGGRGYTVTTAGLARFGLPELRTDDVPPQLVRAWGGALTGIAHHVLRVWARRVRPGPDGAPPAFVELPAVLEVEADDVAAAYATVAGTPGSTRVALRFDPVSPDEPSHFSVVPPEDYPASAGEFLAEVCAALFGATPSTVVYAKGSGSMARAMQRARRQLPAVRRRFLEGALPRSAHLMIKYPVERGADREYVWAYVTSWDQPDRIRGAAAVDAALDPRVRVGRPVSVPETDVVDWAVWIDGEGIVEGGATNDVLEAPPAAAWSTVGALLQGAGQTATVAAARARSLAAAAWRAARAAGAARRAASGSARTPDRVSLDGRVTDQDSGDADATGERGERTA